MGAMQREEQRETAGLVGEAIGHWLAIRAWEEDPNAADAWAVMLAFHVTKMGL